ncbi:MAG: ATP synthase F1 subunit gamma [Chitinophagaceae bacterium]|nr:ATP synthase F1 subunit gamma [Chitinophagaceae bacterium]
MANLKEIKNRIQSVISTQQITKAMKMVSAAKFKKSSDSLSQFRTYYQKLLTTTQEVYYHNTDGIQVPYSEKRNKEKIAIVVISSDKGLCGPFNNFLFKSVINLLQTNYSDQHHKKQITLITIGKKSVEYFKKRKIDINTDYTQLLQGISFSNIKALSVFLIQSFQNKQYDAIHLVFNEFKNASSQTVKIENIFPIPTDTLFPKQTTHTDYIFEPNKQYIFNNLIIKLIETQIYKSVLESIASEHGARMTAMEKATENAGELLKVLKIMYNRTRQASITKEILEIVGGAEALKTS